jgi:hypothetical protein
MIETTEVEKPAAQKKKLPAPLAPLERLAWNYWWSWAADGAGVFRDLDPEIWDTRRFLFAGIVPGIVLIGMLSAVAVTVAIWKKLPRQKFEFGELALSFLLALPELFVPFGVILGLAYQKTGALFMSMGIHGGIVFGAKLFAAAANSAPGANVWLWGTEKLIDGWFSFFLMLAVTIAFLRWRSKRV